MLIVASLGVFDLARMCDACIHATRLFVSCLRAVAVCKLANSFNIAKSIRMMA